MASERVGVGEAAGPKIVKPPPSTVGFARTTNRRNEIVSLVFYRMACTMVQITEKELEKEL